MTTTKVTSDVEKLIASGMTIEQITQRVDPRYPLWDSYEEAYVVHNAAALGRLENLVYATEKPAAQAAPKPPAAALATDKQVSYAMSLIRSRVGYGLPAHLELDAPALRALTRNQISRIISELKEQY